MPTSHHRRRIFKLNGNAVSFVRHTLFSHLGGRPGKESLVSHACPPGRAIDMARSGLKRCGKPENQLFFLPGIMDFPLMGHRNPASSVLLGSGDLAVADVTMVVLGR